MQSIIVRPAAANLPTTANIEIGFVVTFRITEP